MPNSNTVVLVVDDEEIDSVLMRRSLERAGGFSVLEARSYDAATQLFTERGGEIDLLIVDVSLPGQNGVDLARSLLRKRPDLKVLFVSGWVGAELLRSHGIVESDRHFLGKPFRPSELLDRVRSVLGESGGVEWLSGDGAFDGQTDGA
jgi:two-component system, cell cycle sensor histidine kinase and response regulator CckA